MQFPNYTNSSFNTINSILHYYGVKNNYESLKTLDQLLNTKKYKKVVLLIMDGFGNNIVNKYLKNEFLERNNYGPISSVFPSTTTAAMNTYYSGKTPLEHAWLGWSNYFKECSRTINLFPKTDKYTHEKIEFDFESLIKFESIFDQIKKVNDIQQVVIYPKYLKNDYPVKNLKYKKLKGMVKHIKKQIKGKKEKFIFAYSPEPDHTEHMFGPSNKKVEKLLNSFNKLMEKNFSKLNDDTLIIISADHGLIDIKNTIYLEDHPALLETLITLPTIEPRAASFFVKKHRKLEFESLFNDIFKDNYVLFTRDEVLRHHLFGYGNMHPKADDFLGDYLAVATKNTIFDYKRDKSNFTFKGHHAGMSPDEMNIPLIILKKD